MARPPVSLPTLRPRRLRRDYQIEAGIPIVLSTEKPRCGLVYSGEEGANPLDYQARGGRGLGWGPGLRLLWRRHRQQVVVASWQQRRLLKRQGLDS